MNDKFDDLTRDYRAIEAPPQLAARVRAAIASRPRRAFHWLPVAAAVATAIALLVFAPPMMELPPEPGLMAKTPSLTALSRVAAQRRSVPTPNLSHVRSLRPPALPPKPRLRSSDDKPTIRDMESQRMEEMHHDYV